MVHSLRLTMDEPAEYLIVVQGHMDPERAAWFNGMSIEGGRLEHRPVTYLQGTIRDQAALQGMLRSLYTLGMPLLALCLSHRKATDAKENE